jgi:hypothetical protein
MRTFLVVAVIGLTTVGCAGMKDEVWTVSERMVLAPGKDFTRCADEAVRAVQGLSSAEDRAMSPYFDGYLLLGGPAVAKLDGIVGDLSLRGSTIQVEFSSHRRRMPDEAARDVAGRLVAELRSRLASSCS